MLRRTADDQRSSRANGNRESDKKDSKSAKKDSDTNTATTGADSKSTEEKASLPITFLLGLPSEQFASFDAGEGSNSSLSNSGGKASNQSAQAKLGGPAAGTSDGGDQTALLFQAQAMTLTGLIDSAGSEASDGSASTAKNPATLGIGESGNSTKGAVGALSANTLAFAMRLGSGGQAISSSKAASSSEAASSPASDSIQSGAVAATPKIVEAVSGSELEANAHEHDGSGQEQNVVVDPAAIPGSEPFEAAKSAEDDTTSAAAQVPAEPPATTEPVRNVHMQLVGDDNRRVDVRLIDRGGELHVSVKSADPVLTQNLQDHLPDLTARLDKQQMQTEVWVPKAAEPAKADGGNTNGSLSDPNARSYSSNSEGGKEGQHQRKPDWVDALENYT